MQFFSLKFEGRYRVTDSFVINASFFIVDAKYMGGNIQNLDGDRIYYTVRLVS